MNKLRQNDQLLKPTLKNINDIIELVGEENLPVSALTFTKMSDAMNGIFWSDRKRTVISGVIGGARVYGSDEFIERLKNTVLC